jgi:glutaredoxin
MILSTLGKIRSMMIGPAGPFREVIVYSRQGCSCCEKAMAELEKASSKYRLKIQLVDIDQDEKLLKLYHLEVPVIAIDGKVRFKGKINPVLLERILSHAPDSAEENDQKTE